MLIFEIILPNRVNNKCPAIIFAVKRTIKVIGRIIVLIDSIKIIKGIKIFGVPWGTKWVNIWLVLFNHPKIIRDIHNGIENLKLEVKWLVLVKINGNRPKKLLRRIKIKIEINIKLKLLFFLLLIIWNSLYKILFIFKINKLKLFGIIQKKLGKINNSKIDEIQFIDKLKIKKFVEGSNIENKLVIIFNC